MNQFQIFDKEFLQAFSVRFPKVFLSIFFDFIWVKLNYEIDDNLHDGDDWHFLVFFFFDLIKEVHYDVDDEVL